MVSRDHGAQRSDVADERLVQSEQANIFGQDTVYDCLRLCQILLVCGDVLRIKGRNFEQKERDATLVAAT